MNLYLKYINEGYEYLYLLDCYFYDTQRKCGLYWGGYRMSNNAGHPAGIGRMLSKNLMDKLEWKPWYDVKLSGRLDEAMNQKMAEIRPKARSIHCLSEGVFALDIKSKVNMTQFDLWDNTVTFNGKFLFNKLPEEEATRIYKGN